MTSYVANRTRPAAAHGGDGQRQPGRRVARGDSRTFGVQPVRGSSSRRGGQALLELTTWAERGYDLAITPDGPRGPCYVVQEGVISTGAIDRPAACAGVVSFELENPVKSWDRFQIPLPFARCEITVGRVMRVPREATDAERESLRQQLEAELRAITRD